MKNIYICISLIFLFSTVCAQDNYNLTKKSLSSLIFLDIDNDVDLEVFGVETGMSAGEIFITELK